MGRNGSQPENSDRSFVAVSPFVFSWWRAFWFGMAGFAVGASAWWVDDYDKHQVVLSMEFDPRSIASLAGGGGSAHLQVVREFLETQAIIATSQVVCERAVDAVAGLPHGFKAEGVKAKEQFASHVCRKLQAQRVGESLIVELRYNDDDLERAKLVIDAVADAYVRRALAARADTSQSLVQWASELEGFDAELGEHERSLAAFSREHHIASVDTEEALAMSTLRAYSEALTETRIQRVHMTAKVAQLEFAVTRANVQRPHIEDGNLSILSARIQELEAERQRLALSSDGHHPRLPAIQADLINARSELDDRLRAVVASARSDLLVVEKQERDLLHALEQTQRVALDLAEMRVEHASLQRTAARTKAVRQALLGRVEKTGLAQPADGWLVRVLSPGHSVRRRSIVPFAFALCSICALAFFVTRSRRDTTAAKQREIGTR